MALPAGVLTALLCVWLIDRAGFWPVVHLEPFVPTKWQPSGAGDYPVFYQTPSVRTGGAFRRRSGPRVEERNVLGFVPGFDAPDPRYADTPPVRVSYGRYGFRDEYPAVEGGMALLGDSYLEAGFAAAPETIVGWLHRDYGIEAANFGVSLTGGFSHLHFLSHFVLPTRPAQVVWVFSDRHQFNQIPKEFAYVRAYGRPERLLPGLSTYLSQTVSGFAGIALAEGRQTLAQWESLVGLGHRSESPPPAPTVTFLLGNESHDITIGDPPDPARIEQSRPYLRIVLYWLKHLSEEAGAEAGVVYLPSRRDLLRRAFDPDAPRGTTHGFRVLQEEAAAIGLRIADTTPRLTRELAAGRMVLNHRDQHLNSAGMRIVAGVIHDLMLAPPQPETTGRDPATAAAEGPR
jgi:hypothetical protein